MYPEGWSLMPHASCRPHWTRRTLSFPTQTPKIIAGWISAWVYVLAFKHSFKLLCRKCRRNGGDWTMLVSKLVLVQNMIGLLAVGTSLHLSTESIHFGIQCAFKYTSIYKINQKSWEIHKSHAGKNSARELAAATKFHEDVGKKIPKAHQS